MTWVILPAKKHFEEYSATWDELNRRAFQNHPLLDSRFIGPLIEHFATEREVIALSRSCSESPSMLLLTQTGWGISRSFIPSQTEISPVLLGSFNHVPKLMDELPAAAVALELYSQDPDYCAIPTIQHSLAHELTPHGLTLTIELDGNFSGYWLSRPRSLQKSISKTLRRIARTKLRCHLKVITEPVDVEHAVERYGELEAKGWKGASGTAVHNNNVQGLFYRDVFRRYSETGRAIVYELYFDDELASSQLAICNDFILVTLKTTYNEALRRYSPGRLLDYFFLKHEFDRKKFQKIEFCTNAGPQDLKWGTRNRYIQHVTIYRNRYIRLLARIYRRAKNVTRKLLRI
jgi:hypothetical protein